MPAMPDSPLQYRFPLPEGHNTGVIGSFPTFLKGRDIKRFAALPYLDKLYHSPTLRRIITPHRICTGKILYLRLPRKR